MNEMVVVCPGDEVLKLIGRAQSRVTVAAPFIKSSTIRRLLNHVPETVSEFICITRWLPEDIASGVCDLEIFEDVTKLRGGRLLVHPLLHAKYYSNGQEVLVGSSNLTSRGLGWQVPANMELLVELPMNFLGLKEWEAALLNSAIVATDQLHQQVRLEADKILQNGMPANTPKFETKTSDDKSDEIWLPRCPVPERLWEVYCGHGNDTMVSSALKSAQDDIAALQLPQSLTEDLFLAYISAVLRQMPLFAEIDKLASTGLTDANARKLLLSYIDRHRRNINEVDRIWQVIKQWLTYFFSESYRLEMGQETLIKGREISSR